MYDNVCKFLAENFSADLASWLIGQPIAFTQLNPTELNLEPIRADSLILLDSIDLILHLEFQTRPDAGIPARMANYRLRLYARFPGKAVRQIVIYLKPSKSPLVHETSFEISGLRHEFEAIRLWEQPVAAFLQAPGLLPFAMLGNSQEPLEVLQQVADRADAIVEPSVRGNVMAASAVLAGLVLEKDSIRQILRSDAIPSKMTMTTITLQLPQNIYESLQKAAARAGQSPEELITQLLGQTVQNFADDPLEEFIGAFRSDIPDWGENHDRYLGQGLMETHNA